MSTNTGKESLFDARTTGEQIIATAEELQRRLDRVKADINACIGDAYWITLNPGPGNSNSARELYANLKRIQKDLG